MVRSITAASGPSMGASSASDEIQPAPPQAEAAARRMELAIAPRSSLLRGGIGQDPIALRDGTRRVSAGAAGMPSADLHRHSLQAAMLATLSKHVDDELLARPDVQDRLRTNADALALAGIGTPAQLKRFTKECHHHDLRCAAFGLGFTNNVGYAVGMTAANEKLVSLLPASILSNPPLTGLIVGLGVGGLDVLCNVVGGKIANDRMFNGKDGNRKLPPSMPDHSQTVLGFLKSISRAALLNVAKNATRVAASMPLCSTAGWGSFRTQPMP
jgi:hypothetical protein